MYEFIFFKEGLEILRIHNLCVKNLGDSLINHFIGNPHELIEGIHRSFCPYKDFTKKIKILPFFLYKGYHIDLCISINTPYTRGSIITNDLKIIGVFTNIHNLSYDKRWENRINKNDIKILADILTHLKRYEAPHNSPGIRGCFLI